MATARKRAAKKSKKDLAPQSDPQAPLDGAAFLSAAKPVLATLAKDLMERAEASKAITQALVARYEADKQAKRTAEAYLGWRQAFVDQVAAAWLLSCVFVRVLEDRGLVGNARIAGPGAADSQHLFFQMGPSLTERDYLWTLFRELSRTPAAEALFDPRHNPVWLLGPSGEAIKVLLNLFRMPNAEAPAFRFGGADTRFLGDLYQDLNDDVKKRYALLQTPRFVERFILDRTLDRAIELFGLDEATLIDPTCGSGHFLLGAFDRLFERRRQAEPGTDVRQVAIKALDAVAGSDINPYAVAIARFRLTLAFLDKAELEKLSDAPRLPLHMVVADSLLHNPQLAQQHLKDLDGQKAEAWEGELFALEDEKAAREVLYRRYSAVVGNPPYITVKDAVLRDRYREFYSSAYREYSLSVPFTERFFQLARDRGAVGMITANSFMKREFGKKLIEEYIPTVNLDLIINTSGAYIPGHGTPTVLLFGTSAPPQGAGTHTVLASRGEPSTPEDPEQGLVWSSIANHWDEEGFENEFISVAIVERSSLGKHPWSLGGGGAAELKELLEERAACRLADHVSSIGFMCITKQDDVFTQPLGVLFRSGVEQDWIVKFVVGEHVRDWATNCDVEVVFPYTEAGELRPLDANSGAGRFLWRYRTVLEARAVFGGSTFGESGRKHYEFGQIPKDRIGGKTVGFPFVATHNHFVLSQGGKVFNRTAPIIKLPKTATEDDHLVLLAYLNSSTACFWMKQVFHKKSSASQKHHTDPARAAYEFAGTGLEKLPLPHLPRKELTEIARMLLALGDERARWLSGSVVSEALAKTERNEGSTLQEVIETGWTNFDSVTSRSVYLQEQVDWLVYGAFGLVDGHLADSELNEREATPLGSRPFEHETGYDAGVSARVMGHVRSEAIAQRPEQWNRRISALKDRTISALENREFKRMWRETEHNVSLAEFRVSAARKWLSDYLTIRMEHCARSASAPSTLSHLTSAKAVCEHLTEVAEYLEVQPSTLAAELVKDSAVAHLACLRYADSGIEKHLAWQATWDLQRREDAGEDVGEITVPPKYAQGDFRDPTYWRLRGKLDVPKERFISYPGCESDENNEPVYGWAGWDHLQQAQALAALYQDRKDREGWTADRLTPMLAGLLELLPWLLQWHNEPSEEFDGLQLGEYFQSYLDEQCRELGLTLDDLRDWRPEARGRGRRKG